MSIFRRDVYKSMLEVSPQKEVIEELTRRIDVLDKKAEADSEYLEMSLLSIRQQISELQEALQHMWRHAQNSKPINYGGTSDE